LNSGETQPGATEEEELVMARTAFLALAPALLLAFSTTPAAAEDTDTESDRLDRCGDRIERRLDRLGDRIDWRLDRRGDRIDRRLDRRGDRIDHRLDRRGDRINRRLDRRARRN
jgi:hypothetical protein